MPYLHSHCSCQLLPRYLPYPTCHPAVFSHLVPQMYLQDLAEADASKELIQSVQVNRDGRTSISSRASGDVGSLHEWLEQ
jgi:hypothetical protein